MCPRPSPQMLSLTHLLLVLALTVQDDGQTTHQDVDGAKSSAESSRATPVAQTPMRCVVPRSWDFLLPRENWRPLTSPLVLNGVEYAVAAEDPGLLRLDTNGDGRPEKRITGKYALVRLQADGAAPYTLRLRRVGDGWDWSSACIMAGRVEGTIVQLIDLDGDGRFDGYGKDAMVIGGERAACFLSPVASISDRLYHLKVTPTGDQTSTTPYEGPTARLNVTEGFRSRGELLAAIFSDGDISFDLADAPTGKRIPAGSYRFVSGVAAKGRETVLMSAGAMPPIVLADEEDHTLTWGGPVSVGFRCTVQDGELTVFSNLRFTGSGGEQYSSFTPDANPPRIRVIDRRTGKVVQYGRMGGCCGGGFSAYVARVPAEARLEVRLEHQRGLFARIEGRARPRTNREPRWR